MTQYKIKRIDGYMVVDDKGVQVSPDFLMKTEAKNWIKGRKSE